MEKRWEITSTDRPAKIVRMFSNSSSLGPGVEGRGGLVEDDERGVPEERPGQRHPLPLAHRQVAAPHELLAHAGRDSRWGRRGE